MAYRKFSFQMIGGPAWFESDRYDIDAKPDDALGEQIQKLSRAQREAVQSRMLRVLLEDRLKLKTHQEERQMPIFTLTIAKGGLKMHEAKPQETFSMTVGNGKITAQAISMEELADNLMGNMEHIVRDQTGLKSVYDVTLTYSDDGNAAADTSAPSIYTALQEQLGLKLEPAKGPVEVLVIGRVERPSQN